MKALPSIPTQSSLGMILDFIFIKEPTLVLVETGPNLRPVEIKRFIRNLRRQRQFE